MKKIFFCSLIILALFSCEDEDDSSPSTSANTNTTNNNGGGNSDSTTVFDNSYKFSDTTQVCKPISSNFFSIGVLSVVSEPCGNLSSKLDGYFRGTPSAGTYTVVGTVGSVTFTPFLDPGEVSLVFYNHGQSTLYSTGGTVEVSKSTSDTSKFNLDWKDIDMTYEHDSSTIQFSGNLKDL